RRAWPGSLRRRDESHERPRHLDRREVVVAVDPHDCSGPHAVELMHPHVCRPVRPGVGHDVKVGDDLGARAVSVRDPAGADRTACALAMFSIASSPFLPPSLIFATSSLSIPRMNSWSPAMAALSASPRSASTLVRSEGTLADLRSD